MQAFAQPVHERRPWSNTIGIKMRLLRPLRGQVGALGLQIGADPSYFLDLFLGFLGGAETAGALLVHLCSGCLESFLLIEDI